MNRFMHWLASASMVVAASQFTGCASVQMGHPTASMENTIKMRDGSIKAPAAVGTFALAAGKPSSMDQSVSARSNTLTSPIDNSFAQYLKETLRVELEGAQLLDPGSTTRISGTLLDSMLDSSIGTGKGHLQARFVVTQADAIKYDRSLEVSPEWESSFIGAVAIPDAMNNYQLMYRKLVGQLFDDPDFRKALVK